MAVVIAIMVIFLAWSLVAGRLARWSVTAPLAMAVTGTLLTAGSDPFIVVELETSSAERGVELVLALLLFLDATEIPRTALSRPGRRLPLRLLGIALPLSLVLAWLAGLVLFPGTNLWVLAVLATVVVPIDLAPAASMLKDARIPARLREALNVESGVNDGIVAPLFLWAVAGAQAVDGAGGDSVIGEALLLAAPALGVAIVVGLGIGLVGGELMVLVHRHGWTQPSALRVGVLALPVLAYGIALPFGGNGFIAAFVAGVAFGTFAARLPADALRLTEDVGLMLNLLLWFVFGQVVTNALAGGGVLGMLPFAVVALTVVRMAPVALGLIGTGLRGRDVLLLGWMGPRGLASIVFGLLAFIDLRGSDANLVADAMVVVVGLSLVLHGLSAHFVGSRYGRSSVDPS